MKKKVIEKLEENRISTTDLETLRPLLKGIKVKNKKVKINHSNVLWPVSAKSEDGSLLRMSPYRVEYINSKGLYYCELHDTYEDEKDMVYLAYYKSKKVESLLSLDSDAEIEPYSFYQFGIKPDFETSKFLDKLLPTEENFIEIINDEMKKSKKQAKKLLKEQKNQLF